jgi:hypothetical protein
MEPSVDVDEITQRAQRHWTEDGLSEMMLGLLFIILAGGMLVRLAFPRWLTLDLIFPAITIVGVLGLTRGFKTLKERITFPRSGYVALPEPTRRSRILTFATVFVLGAAFTLVLSAHIVVVPIFAGFFAAIFLWGGVQYKQTSMLWEAILILIFAVVSVWFPSLNGAAGVLALMVMIGTSMAIFGAFRLRGFLKSNPRREATEA